MRETRAALVAHVGGAPSATQRALIERAAQLTLYVSRMDAKALAAGGMTEHDCKTYLAWSNSLSRTLRHLGLKGTAPPAPTLADYLALKAASTSQAPAKPSRGPDATPATTTPTEAA